MNQRQNVSQDKEMINQQSYQQSKTTNQTKLLTFQRLNQLKLFLLIILSISCAINGQAYNTLPFILSQPDLFCPPNHQKCSEKVFCKQISNQYEKQTIDENNFHFQFTNQTNIQYPFELLPKMNRQSIVSQYKLICDRKVGLVTLQTSNMIGHFIGCLFLIIFATKITPKNTLYLIFLSQVMNGIVFLGFSIGGWTYINFGYAFWAFCFQIPNSLLPTIFSFYFQESKVGYYLALFNVFWGAYSPLNPLLYYLSFSWRSFLVIAMGFPSIIIGLLWFKINGKIPLISQQQKMFKKELFQNKDQQLKQVKKQEIEKQNQDKVQQTSQVKYLNLIDIYYSKYFITFICVIFAWVSPFLTGYLTLLSLSSFSGNFVINFLIYNIIELCGGFLGAFLVKKFPTLSITYTFLIITSIIYIVKCFVSLELAPILLLSAKILSDSLWGVINAYTPQAIPKSCLVTFHSTKYGVMLFVGTFTPAMNYLAWLRGVQIFGFVAIIQIMAIFLIYIGQKYNQLRKNNIKISRRSQLSQMLNQTLRKQY